MENKSEHKPSREELDELYSKQGLTQQAIGRLLGFHQVTIGDWLQEYGIAGRHVGLPPQIVIPEAELRELWLNQKLTYRALRARYNCGTSVIQRHLVAYGIMRTRTQASVVRKARRNGQSVEHRERTKGRKMEHQRYVYVKNFGHPYATKEGYVAEHRLVIEKAIGRILEPQEEVHHLDLNRSHNELSNLAVLSKSQHHRFHGYLGRVAVYLSGMSPINPGVFDFRGKVFWAGEWITEVDMTGSRAAVTVN